MNRDVWTTNLWNWPVATTLEMWRRMLVPEPAEHAEGEPQWTTPNRVMLELDVLRLRDFSTETTQPPVLLVAPYALHGAQIADLAPGNSLIEALRENGLHHLFLVEWK